MNTTILAIILTWTCPTGQVKKTQVNHSYPKELEAAIVEFKQYQDGLGTLTKDFQGETCTLTDIRGGHITSKKEVTK